jgi:hypothetical protein
MGIFDGMGYFLSGCDELKGSGKKKPVEQIRREAVDFSNRCWNDILRKKMQYMDILDSRRTLNLVNSCIKSAEQKAKFNHGVFVMAPDVREKYQKLQDMARKDEEMENVKKS